MMPSEIVTSIQEGYKLTIILIDNKGFASIGGLSKSIGNEGFGTRYKYRDQKTGLLEGDYLPVDLAANAESLGAEVIRTDSIASLKKALKQAKSFNKTTVIYIETVPERKIAGYAYAWWDVPVAEVSELKNVQEARVKYDEQRKKQKYYL
jgi:3D-(3,5/4)-trihydroxycyclohexane-1,2-dione acylhydrolase (decyclizing)